jgi:hypothetical protein
MARITLAIVVGVLGCTQPRTSAMPADNAMTITAEQIERLNVTNAYDIVEQTHGNFLHSRGRESHDPKVPATPVHVYLDDAFYGDVSLLRNISVLQIKEIRLYQSYEAQYKFGSGHLGGVIQVITGN